MTERTFTETLLHWLAATAAVMVTAYLLPGVAVSGFFAAFVTAITLGLINTFIRPFLLVLTLPLTVATLGLFALVLNALLVILASAVVPGFTVAGFLWAATFSVVLFLVTVILQTFSPPRRRT